MLFFTKPRPNLADLIPDGYIDIHSHLLPGIDDGAKDEADTLSLINSLHDYGFSSFITTPHIFTGVWNNTRECIQATETATTAVLQENQTNIPFKAAAEYFMDATFLKLLTEEPLLTVKDNYVLVEMSYLNPPLQLYDIIFEMQVRDYKPILAHPERYLFYRGKMDEYKKLKKAGCLLQLNLLSVTGYYGKGILRTAKELLDMGLIDFTGSDVHHQKHVESFKDKVLVKNTDAVVQALNNNSVFKF